MRQKNSTENLDTTPPPLLSINFFATGNFLKHSAEGFNYEIFRHCETKYKIFRRKILILPPSYSNFSGTRNQCNSKRLPEEMFGTVRQKISTENLDSTPPPLLSKLFRYRKFSETQRRRFQLRNFLVSVVPNIYTVYP